MKNHVYKLVELTGTSKTGIEDAVNNAIAKAAETIHHMRWVQVQEVRGDIQENKIDHWQVTVKVGFTIED